MRLPTRLPIERIEDYHTHYLGRTAEGHLFWGYETFVFIKPYSDIEQGDDWRKWRKEYVVLHKFDSEGNYLSTRYCSSLTSESSEQELSGELAKMVAELGDFEFHDIEIKLFQTKIDNITFGLIVDEVSGTINLQPSSTISFQEPWDGGYYT